MLDAREKLQQLVDRHCRTGTRETPVPGLTLHRAEEPTSLVKTLYTPILCVIVQGRKQAVVGDRLYNYDASTYLVNTVSVPVVASIVDASPQTPYLSVALNLDPARITELLLEAPDQPLVDDSRPGIGVAVLDEGLIDAMTRLVQLIDRPLEAAVLGPLVEKEIYYRLLQGGQGPLLRQVATAGTRLSQIKRAADWLRNNYAEPLRVEELAEQVGMSPTSFHRHFKAVTGTSPLQYRTQVRLQEARRMIVFEGRTAGSIAFEVGYDSPSQFSREYHRTFGLPPAADGARLRRWETQASA